MPQVCTKPYILNPNPSPSMPQVCALRVCLYVCARTSHNPISILLLIWHSHMHPPPHRTQTHTIPLVRWHTPTRAFARALIPHLFCARTAKCKKYILNICYILNWGGGGYWRAWAQAPARTHTHTLMQLAYGSSSYDICILLLIGHCFAHKYTHFDATRTHPGM